MTIIPPMPQENPVTTVWGTLEIYRPSRRTQNTIMKTEATMETFAAPLIPCCFTAAAMKKIVTLLVPPMSKGFRPRSTVMGAVITDVSTPSIGGSPMAVAIARPYGSAMSAAITPPKQSPANNRQLYRRACRNIKTPQGAHSAGRDQNLS